MAPPVLELVPITRADARAFIAAHHRHSRPPVGDVFRVAVTNAGNLCGVAMAGRPVARNLDDGRTLEVLRVCVGPGEHFNACSRLYSAIARAGAALGYRRLITYTLETELGASLRASGFTIDDDGVDHRRRRYWRRSSRPRYAENLLGEPIDDLPAVDRVRWSRALS